MVFEQPGHALFGLVFLGIWLADFLHWKKETTLFYPLKVTRSSRPQNLLIGRYGVGILGMIGIFSLTLAMMGPKGSPVVFHEQKEIRDIYFVVDVSRSMLAVDFKPNRLEVMRRKVLEFVQMQPSDRLGVIAFSEKVFTLVPLTFDLNIIQEKIKEIAVGPLGNGTNIGDAIALAVARLSLVPTKHKSIILLTDGVSQVDTITPLESAQMAKNKGIKIYSVGIGTDQNALLPISDGFFGPRYQTIPGGSIDQETLGKISTLTGGKSYMAKDEEALKNVFQEIQKMEKTKIQSLNKTVYKNDFFPFLLWGVFLLILSQTIRAFLLKEVL